MPDDQFDDAESDTVADFDAAESSDDTDVPGGRHTVFPGWIARSPDVAFVVSNVDIDTPARVAISHQVSPDWTV